MRAHIKELAFGNARFWFLPAFFGALYRRGHQAIALVFERRLQLLDNIAQLCRVLVRGAGCVGCYSTWTRNSISGRAFCGVSNRLMASSIAAIFQEISNGDGVELAVYVILAPLKPLLRCRLHAPQGGVAVFDFNYLPLEPFRLHTETPLPVPPRVLAEAA